MKAQGIRMSSQPSIARKFIACTISELVMNANPMTASKVSVCMAYLIETESFAHQTLLASINAANSILLLRGKRGSPRQQECPLCESTASLQDR